MKWAVVVPSNRPERLAKFREAWRSTFSNRFLKFFLVNDSPPWTGIPDFIPKRTDMIRSWGFYQAWKEGARFILSLDDDTIPVPGIFEAYEREFDNPRPLSPYLSVASLIGTDHEMRGFPYAQRHNPVVVQYGGWDGVFDYDAVTQIAHDPPTGEFGNRVIPVPKGCATTCCAMNFAFDARYTPIMWQLPLYEGRYNRFGDIWSGLIQKRVLDAIGGVMLVNGHARVIHDRASDRFTNLEREATGLGRNEQLWDALPQPNTDDMVEAYREVTDAFADQMDTSYAVRFKVWRSQWLALFQ